jgi:cytochrome c-type biogenesis protein CcmE
LKPSAVRARPAVAAVVILAVGLGAALVWRGLRDEKSAPEPLTLAQLAFGQEDYSGRRVRTSGLVERIGPAEGARRLHYVIADEADNRVRLVGVDPAVYVGRAVEVVGRFRLTGTTGRTIDVERIIPDQP